MRILLPIISILSLLSPSAALSADGIVTTAIGSGDDSAYCIAVQSDGRILVAGYSHNGSNTDFALVRFNNDGSLDSWFDGDSGSGNGIVTTAIGSSDESVASVLVQSDGKSLVAGNTDTGGSEDFALARYHSDGTLDSSFGTGGRVITSINSGDDFLRDVALQDDGAILVAGYDHTGSQWEYLVLRYDSNGDLDTSFDGDGIVITDPGNGGRARAIAVQTDGRIVVIGDSYGAVNDFTVARYNSNGSLDTSFGGGDGITVTDLGGGGHDYAQSVAIQDDGNILLGGGTLAANYNFALARYSSLGVLDSGFGGGTGYVLNDLGNFDMGTSVLVQSDGQILLAGYSNGAGNYDFALVRYNSNGSLDTGFDGDTGLGNGIIITAIGSGDEKGVGSALQNDGKILVAGYADIGGANDFALVRYNIDGTLDTTFDGVASGNVDLTLSKTVDDGTPNEGDTIIYTVTVANDGPDAGTFISVLDLLPTGVTYVSDTPSQGSYLSGTGLWTVGAVANASSATLEITATVDGGTAGSTIGNSALITAANQVDSNAANNGDSVDIIVQTTDLAIDKIVDDGTPGEGDTIVYTLTIDNLGPNDATGIAVTDLLPAGVTYVSDTPSQGSYVSGTGVWTVGAVANAGSATLDISATVDPGTGGTTIDNTASITALDQTDPVSGNDSDLIGITVAMSTYKISGVVFEDSDFAGTAMNWDGGASDFALANVDVELYSSADAYLASTTTAGDGSFAFAGLADGGYKVRARSATLGDADTPPAAGLHPTVPATWPYPLPEMTWGHAAALIGGQDPDMDDTATGDDSGPGDTWVAVTVSGADLAGVNLGFCYDIIATEADDGLADTARSRQGCLRQFIKNSNAIVGASTSWFELP